MLPELLRLPAASVAVALTLTAPLPKVVRSSAIKATACDAPVAVTDLVTVPAVPVKVTLTAEPFSAVSVTTPPA